MQGESVVNSDIVVSVNIGIAVNIFCRIKFPTVDERMTSHQPQGKPTSPGRPNETAQLFSYR